MQSDEPLFCEFSDTPPDDKDALKDLVSAFSDYEVDLKLCEHCFDFDTVEAVRQAGRLNSRARKKGRNETADQWARICSLYFESPYCAGISNFKLFLPRMLELCYWQRDGDYYSLLERAVQTGFWGWPEEELQAVRNVFNRAAVNWFSNKDPDPLGHCGYASQWPRSFEYAESDIGYQLIQALVLCRFQPKSIVDWLHQKSGPRAKITLCHLVSNPLEDKGVSYWPREYAGDLNQGMQSLDKLFAVSLDAEVGEDEFLSWFMDYPDEPAGLSRLFENAYEVLTNPYGRERCTFDSNDYRQIEKTVEISGKLYADLRERSCC